MNENSFRQELIEKESRRPEFKEKFQKEFKKMMEKKLDTKQKILISLFMILGIAQFFFFGYLSLSMPAEFPMLGRVAFLSGAVFAAVFFGYCLMALRKGTIHLIKSDNAVWGITWAFIVIMATLFLLLSGQIENEMVGIKMVLNMMVFILLFGVPAAINLRMNRTESALREQLLRLELKLEQMQEEQNRGDS